MKRSTTLLALLMLTACASTLAIEPATLVLKGGKIVAVARAKPEVQAIAIRGDTIAALGTNDETQVYVGRGRMSLKLMGVKDCEAIVSMVGEAAKAAKPGDWIEGRGWHQEKWDHEPTPNVAGVPRPTRSARSRRTTARC